MNIKEEINTNWWAKFAIDHRKYHILIRNLTIKNEYDGIGVRFPAASFTDNFILENIESKWASEAHPERAARKLVSQLIRNREFNIFNYLVGACNSLEAFDRNVPDYLGWILCGNFNKPLPMGKILRIPQAMSQINYEKRYTLSKIIKTFFPAAKAVGLPAIFLKCQLENCNYFYGFQGFEALPEPSDIPSHSEFCFSAKDRVRKYGPLTLEFGFTAPSGETFVISPIRKNFRLK